VWVNAVSECKVLLVDDENDFLETLVQRMRKRNVKVVGAGNAHEALVVLDRDAVDVVVLDVKMPGMDGIQALREIKKRYPAVEVIMLTGHADMDAAIEGMEIGAFDYLMKPANLEELLYKVEKAYERKTLQTP
jgi:DNA-binding NtrC family response regulator